MFDRVITSEKSATTDRLAACVYTSVTTHPISRSDLDDSVRSARSYNARHDITGLLVYKDKHFMQILEGNETDVRRVFERIVRDERHTHILELAWNPIAQRDFPAWSMELADLDAEKIDPAMKETIAASSMRKASHPLHALFQELREEM